jgi:hypothetical protein
LDLFDRSSSASASDQDSWQSPCNCIWSAAAFDDLVTLSHSGFIVYQDSQAAFEHRAADVRLQAV